MNAFKAKQKSLLNLEKTKQKILKQIEQQTKKGTFNLRVGRLDFSQVPFLKAYFISLGYQVKETYADELFLSWADSKEPSVSEV